MAQSNSFCENCGKKMSPDVEYCASCGAHQPENKGKFATLGGFNAPSQQPMAAQEIVSWTGGSLVETIKEFVVNPFETGRRVLPASESPNPIALVIIAGLLAGIIAQIESNKTTYLFNSDIDELSRESIEGALPGLGTNVGLTFGATLLSWYVGSWLLGILVKGGFPMNSPLKFNASEAMRKLNSYRYVPMIVGSIIQLIVLVTAGGQQTVTYGMGIIPIFNVEGPTIIEISGFDTVYSVTQLLIVPLFYAYSLFMMWKAIAANQYSGSALYIILAIMGYFSVIAPIFSLF